MKAQAITLPHHRGFFPLIALGIIFILAANVPIMIDQTKTLLDTAPKLIERGRDFERYDLKNGQFKVIIGVPVWTLDETQNKYVPHTIKHLGDSIEVESGLIGWKIGQGGATITDPVSNEARAFEEWQLFVGSERLPLQYHDQVVQESSSGVTVTNYYRSSFANAPLNIAIEYAIDDGKATKRIVTIDGLPSQYSDQVRMERVWSGIEADGMEIDGINFYNSEVAIQKSASTLQSYAKFTDNGNLVIQENLKTAGDLLEEIDYKRDLVTFKYAGWESGEGKIVLVDDTFSSTAPTVDNSVYSTQVSGADCSTTGEALYNANLYLFKFRSSESSRCYVAFVEWSISSIPDGATISDTLFKFDVIGASSPINCSYFPYASQPSGSTADALYDDGRDGTPYLANDATCTTAGDNKSVDLGASADTEVSSRLTNGDWFAIGIFFHDQTRDGSSHEIEIAEQTTGGATPKPTLEVTYSSGVTLQIRLTAASGSDTMETAGVSATVSGTGCTGTLTHDGNNALQTFTCNASTTITVTYPSDTATSRFRDASGATSFQFTSCASGTCSEESKTMYRQFKQTVTATSITASVTSVTVTRTQLGSSSTQDIAGSTATEIWVDQASTISVEDPVSISATERWDTSGTVSWSNVQSGTSRDTGTYYNQFRQDVTLSGLDASKTIDVTRTQLNSANTQAVTGATLTQIWADSGSTFTIPNEKIITASQERFYSYDSAATRSYTVSATNTKTITFQKEFYQLFRVYEEHIGTLFEPMPSLSLTATITTANSTTIAGTFSTQNSDDRVELSSRYWVKNGTQTAGAITWRNIEVRPSGDTCSVTSYGTCDFEVYSKHYGLGASKHHFRVGVDGLTAEIDNLNFDSSTNILTFNATASGTRTVKVEFLTQNFETVNVVEFNDTPISGADFTVTNIDSATKLLSITGQSFSEKKIEVTFASGSSSSPSGSPGGGGGGGSGSGTGLPLGGITPPGGTALTLLVTPPQFAVAPGSCQEQEIMVEWQGATAIVITEVAFNKNSEWFTIGYSLPHKALINPGDSTLKTTVPLKACVPASQQGIQEMVDMKLTANTGAATASVNAPIRLTLGAANDLAVYAGVAVGVAVVGGLAAKSIKRR